MGLVVDSIQRITATTKQCVPDLERAKEEYGVANPRDFSYGQILGKIRGVAMTIFVSTYAREMTHEELHELDEIIKNNTGEIKDLCYKDAWSNQFYISIISLNNIMPGDSGQPESK